MNKKTLAASVLSLACCGSLVTGATFALFTSETSNQVTITSGKVAVSATIKNVSVYSPAGIYENGEIADADCHGDVVNNGNGGVFANGGTAELDAESAVLTLSKMTPGDKVNFDIEIVNDSNVAVQYRTLAYTESDGGLIDALDIQLGENDFDGSNLYSNWEFLSVDDKVITVKCEVELPADVGNTYQDMDCSIAFHVKAVQGNTTTTNAVARVGEGYFNTIEEAIENAEKGETVEIIRAGTYAPFVVSKSDITVKGIIGKTKAESTIIKNTATERLTVTGEGVANVTLDSLWVDSTTKQVSTVWDDMYNLCAISTKVRNEEPWNIPDNVTITNCHIVGNGVQRVTNTMCSTFTFTNNYVENVAGINYYEASVGATHTYSGNRIAKVNGEMFIFSAYDDADFNLTISDNTLVNDGSFAQFTISDLGKTTAFANLVLTNNSGNICHFLNNFNNSVVTPHTVTLGKDASVVYATTVAFEGITEENKGKYKYENADGSALHEWFNGEISANTWILAGDYNLVEKETGNVVSHFTVEIPSVGVKQTVELPEVVTVGTVADLKKALDTAEPFSADTMAINITSDIDVKGEWTAYELPYATGCIIINGNDKKITGLTHPLLLGSTAGNSAIEINSLTISGATIQDPAYEVLGLGAFIARGDASSHYKFTNCHVVDSVIDCDYDVTDSNKNGYAGGILGYASCDVTMISCSVVNTTINGHKSAGALAGHIQGEYTVEDCKVEECTITEDLEGRTSAGAALIVGRLNGGSRLILKGKITLKGNTVNQGVACTGTATSIYCANANADATAATIVTE